MTAGQGRRWILTGPGAVSSHAAKGQPPPSARNTQASLSWRRHGVPELPVSVGFLVEGGVSTVAALASATALAAAAYTGTLMAGLAVRESVTVAGRAERARVARVHGRGAQPRDPVRE